MAGQAEARRASEPLKSSPESPSSEIGSGADPEATVEADIARSVVNFRIFEGGMGARK
jgi:hypothetical protein